MTALLKTTYKIRAALLTLGTGLMICSSCTDEDFVKSPQNGDRMSFGVSISDQWTAGHSTRSAEPQQPKYEAYQFDNSDMWIVASAEANFTGGCFAEIQPSTRATEGNSNNFETLYKSFGVYAYVRSHSETDWNQSEASVYINDDEPVKNGSIWENSPVRYWPGADYDMSFFAYAPKKLDFKDKTGSKNELELEYRVAQKAENQQDILATELTAAAGDRNSTLDLHFKHLLTAVKVKLKEGDLKDFGTVSKVSISGVQGHGLYDATTATWQKDYDTKTMEFTSEPTVGGDDEANIVYGEFTFMMLPQALTENAKIKIEFSDGKQALEGTIGGGDKTDWEKSAKVIYTISKTGDITVFRVLDEYGNELSNPIEFALQGETKKFQVESYRLKNGVKEPLPWKWEKTGTPTGYWQISPNEYQMISGSVLYENGSIEIDAAGNFTFTNDNKDSYLKEMIYDKDDPHIKGEAIQRKHENLYVNNGFTTANCYLIHHFGYQYIPLVYGNAIKDGTDNKSSYKNKQFKDGLGKEISSPIIEIDKLENYEAVLYWEDGDISLFNFSENRNQKWSDLWLVDGKDLYPNGYPSDYPQYTGNYNPKDLKYIKFRIITENVDGKDLPVCNALVALQRKSDHKVIWTWHLWFTPLKFPLEDRYLQTFNGADGKSYKFLPLNLGQTFGGTLTYTGTQKSINIRFTQYDTDNLTVIAKPEYKLSQGSLNGSSITQTITGSSNLYQWGRPTSFPGEVGSTVRNIISGKAGNSYRPGQIEFSNSQVSLGDAVANPLVFYYNNTDNWCTEEHFNLWDASMNGRDGYTTTTTAWKKTVYDPCPAGFMVPPINVIFLHSSWISGDPFTTTSGTLTLPGSGYYNGKTGKVVVSSSKDGTKLGMYWGSRISDDSNNFYPWSLNTGVASVQRGPGAAHGFAIRPMKEPE